jgi:hypothetical protein
VEVTVEVIEIIIIGIGIVDDGDSSRIDDITMIIIIYIIIIVLIIIIGVVIIAAIVIIVIIIIINILILGNRLYVSGCKLDSNCGRHRSIIYGKQ